MASGRSKVVNLLNYLSSSSCRCPAHSQAYSGPINRLSPGAAPILAHNHSHRHIASEKPLPDYAFEMACSNIRYGPGVTQEVGMDLANMKVKKVGVFTDQNLVKLPVMKTVLESLTKSNVNFVLYDEVRVEPTNESFLKARAFAIEHQFDAFLAVGGGSVIDTTKAANLYMTDPDADFLDYVATPIGKAKPITFPLKPLIAIPTTSGTGSETTGVAVFDHLPAEAKTGIANRALRPLLGIIDPLHTLTMPERVAAFSGFDVLCHALESFTAVKYDERVPRPTDPMLRPAYQGSNPISDVWAKHSLAMISKYFHRSVYNPDDHEARNQMHMASTFAGIGFGNAGVHLCHGLSYPIAGMAESTSKYNPEDYNKDFAIVPHGLSVVITSPAVFNFTAPMCPERHIEAAGILGHDITNAKREDAGKILGDVCRKYMEDLQIPDGLKAIGYSNSDIPALVKGTGAAERVTKMSPRSHTDDDLYGIFENSMTAYN